MEPSDPDGPTGSCRRSGWARLLEWAVQLARELDEHPGPHWHAGTVHAGGTRLSYVVSVTTVDGHVGGRHGLAPLRRR